MRLLHTSTFQLKEFFDREVPEYAILSHTWGDEEITFQKLQQKDSIKLLQTTKRRIGRGEQLENIQGIKKGFLKILGCALQAEKDGYEYVWCDTCCIDKTNSSELSEAINSMYYWYKDHLCYAYLSDVPHSSQPILERESIFAQSRWFTRGWTLQELIAPSRVAFFDQDWKFLGVRQYLGELLSNITGIDKEALEGEDPSDFSIAQRMSWASNRETTRIEDTAYCLMGIFGVNMPLLYGERQRAFIRLQEEIMKMSEDQSLFAWKIPINEANEISKWSGLLASSPAYFRESRCHVGVPNTPLEGTSENSYIAPYSMTNRGISISLSMARVKQTNEFLDVFLAILDCHDKSDARGPLAIFIGRDRRGYYRRRNLHELILASASSLRTSSRPKIVDREFRKKKIFVQQHNIPFSARLGYSQYKFHLPSLPDELSQHGLGFHVFPSELTTTTDPNKGILRSARGLTAAIYIGNSTGNGVILLIGIDSQIFARCSFDDADNERDILYQPHHTDKLVLAPKLVNYRRGDYEANISKLNDGYDALTALKPEEKPDWDSWISRTRRNCAVLTIRTEAGDPFDLAIKATLGEAVVEGQKVFELRFNST